MAEFKDVINQWMRKCEACDRHEKVKCGIKGFVCDGFYKMRKYINPEFVEQDVMAWAAEHPDPIYPTWEEWLSDKYNLAYNDDFRLAMSREHIPADDAQKLGLQPKE